MSKSIYSLVLDDKLVSMIDALANKQGKSRSAAVNEILARELEYETKEMRSRNMLSIINNTLSESDAFGILMQDTSMLLRSVLAYKYNPTVRYTLEVQSKGATLRVNVRSRSEVFINRYEAFLNAWYEAENECKRGELCSYADGRFSRKMYALTESTEETAAAMAEYIQSFDNALKSYFIEAENKDAAKNTVEEIYHDYISEYGKILL